MGGIATCKTACCEQPKGQEVAACNIGGCIIPRCGNMFTRLQVLAELAEGVEADDEVESEHQCHVFTFWNDLSEEQQTALEHQFDTIEDCFFLEGFLEKQLQMVRDQQELHHEPPKVMDWNRKKLPTLGRGANLTHWDSVEHYRQAMWRAWGLDMYGKSQIGIVILHGGLSSSFGESMPKGILDFGLISHKSTMQLFFERISKLQHLAERRCGHGVTIPIYIMCNEHNYLVLHDFLEENCYFGLEKEDVFLFRQGNAPLLDLKGRLLLSEKDNIYEEPSGNGYLFKALSQDGLASDMKCRNVHAIYVCTIDNVLTKIGDPAFLGYCKQCNAEAGLKLFQREGKEEPFGVYLSKAMEVEEDVDGDGDLDKKMKPKAAVVESFELADEENRTKEHDVHRLVYDCANFSQYFFKLDFIARVSHQHVHHHHHHHHHKEDGPPPGSRWHPILKYQSRVNLVTGEIIVPEKERNAYRMEQFLFDCFEFTDRVAGLKTSRSELGLLKKMTGPSSPSNVVMAMGKLHQKWIKDAGGEFSGNKVASDREDAKCEISPLVSYDGEDLSGQFWMPIELPFYFPSRDEDSHCTAAQMEHPRRQSLHFVNWEGEYAQKNLERELQFALEKVFDQTPEGPDYNGEVAVGWEQLPPTPKMSDIEAAIFEQQQAQEKKNRQDRQSRADAQKKADTEFTDWLLGPRMKKEPKAEALVGSPRMMVDKEPNSLLGVSRSDAKMRFKNNMRGSPDSSPRGSARMSEVGSIRNSLIQDAHVSGALSLRCVPPGRQGLETSEYGVRPAHIRWGDAQWWKGKPTKESIARDSLAMTGGGVIVPRGLMDNCVIC